VSGDEQIRRYLRNVRSALHVPRQHRRRAIEEITNHLDDAAATHMRSGATREQAVASAISELGQPESVAAGFNDAGAHGSDSTGLRRWLPLVPPIVQFVVASVLLAWSVRWFAGGWSVGERTAQRAYLLTTVIAGALAYGAYVSIKRAQHDAAWRWSAWLCAGLALVIAVVGLS
jgi:hypothetical protein